MLILFILLNITAVSVFFASRAISRAYTHHREDRKNREAKKLFWRLMRAHARADIPTPIKAATFDVMVQAGQLLYKQ